MDDTRLVAPPGAMITSGAVTEGTTVIATYRGQKGENVLTELAVEEPSASPRSQPSSPRRRRRPPPGGSRPRN
jgi:hypothetical protein